jgi:O-acetyl-ADP-ribose deacetylase (regulator of RNase III)
MSTETPFHLVLVDPNRGLIEQFRLRFAGVPNVEIVQGRFEDLSRFDCMVSPANSFGLMDGGVDAAISDFFGWDLQKQVQRRIIEEFYGEQPVGTSMLVETGHPEHPFLAHSPTMRVPMSISETDHVYLSMGAWIRVVRNHNRQSDRAIQVVACPGLGTGVGGVPFAKAAWQMSLAYRHAMNPPQELGWNLARNRQVDLEHGLELRELEEESGPSS